MGMSVQELGDALVALSPADAKALRMDLKERLGVEAPGGDGPVLGPPPKELTQEVAPAQTEFDVVLGETPTPAKIGVIKLVREVTGLALGDAKNYVETGFATKPLKEQIPKADADALVERVKAAGGTAGVK